MSDEYYEEPEYKPDCKAGCGAKAKHNGYCEWCDPDAPDDYDE